MNLLSMKHKTFIYLSFLLAVILFACSKDHKPLSKNEVLSEEQTAANNSKGATQISALLVAGLEELQGSTVGPDQALYVTAHQRF